MMFDIDFRESTSPNCALFSKVRRRGVAYEIFDKMMAFASGNTLPEKILSDSYLETDPEALVTVLSYLADVETHNTIFSDAVKIRALECLAHPNESVRVQASNTFVSHAKSDECIQLLTQILESDVSYEDKLTAVEHLSLIEKPQKSLALRLSLARLANDQEGDLFLRRAAVERLMEYGLVCD